MTVKNLENWIKSLKSTARAKQMYPTQIRKIFKAGMREFNNFDNDIIRIKYNPFDALDIPSGDLPELNWYKKF